MLSFKVIPSPLNLDLILLSISISNYSHTLGSFYWPPNDNGSLDILTNFLTSLSHDCMKNFFLTGDFNINFMSPSPLLTKLLNFTNSIGLSQVVKEPTHYSHLGTPSIIDLIFVPSNLSCLSFVFPPFSSSDHNSLLFIVPLRQHCKPPSKNLHNIWLYSKGDFKAANVIPYSLPWDFLLSSTDVNYSWSILKDIFVEVMNRTIPSKLVPIKNSPPWANNHLLSCIRKCNALFTKAKRAKSSSLMSQYRICRNKTLSYQRHLKSTFFHKLSPSSSSKDFWSLFKKLNKKSSSIPTVYFNGSSATTALPKANMINQFFCNCFNLYVSPLSTASEDSGPSEDCPSYLLCSNVEVAKLLLQIPPNTSTGPDGISAHMLRETAYSISSPLVSFLTTGKTLILSLHQSTLELHLLPQVIIPYLYYHLSAKF